MDGDVDFYSSGKYWDGRTEYDSSYKVKLALRALSGAKVELQPGLRAIEIGCGTGPFLFPLAKALDAAIGKFELRGVDVAANAIEHAKRTAEVVGDERISFAVGSSDVGGHFDLVFLMDVVEHVTDPFSFLRSLHGLAPLVVMHIPIEQSLAHSALSKPRQSYERYHHIHFFSIETLHLLVEEAGFEIVVMQLTAASPEVLHIYGNPVLKAARLIRYCSYKVAPRLSGILMGGSVMVVMKPVS